MARPFGLPGHTRMARVFDTLPAPKALALQHLSRLHNLCRFGGFPLHRGRLQCGTYCPAGFTSRPRGRLRFCDECSSTATPLSLPPHPSGTPPEEGNSEQQGLSRIGSGGIY